MKYNRREFLAKSGCVLSMTALATQMRHFGLMSAVAQERELEKQDSHSANIEYKALVCVFLGGGNDGNNTVVPKYNEGYDQYAAARQAQGLAIARDSLLSINPPTMGLEFGLHPGMPELQSLFQQNKLAVVTNVGTLIQPLTRTQYQTGSPRPVQLFSHPNQIEQHQTAIANRTSTTGWGGRLADRTANLNTGGAISMISSLTSGANVFNVGNSTQPLVVAPAPTPLNQVLALNGFGTAADELARRTAMNNIRQADLSNSMVAAASALTQQAVNVSEQLSVDPILTAIFPNTSLGNQLKQVAKLIKFRTQLNMSRQIFFVRLGGADFDTHTLQLSRHAALLTQLSQALKAFYDETVAQNVESQVTTFTLSDFNRTLNPGQVGSNAGSDHGWGNHHFVLGGAVKGGDFYGRPTSNGSIFPSLLNGTADDADTRGRFIPTASVEMYAATLARWFGLPEADIPLVYPNVNNFPVSNLGFML